MNEIFNPYSKFLIVYIVDVLIYLFNIDQHFKHIKTFVSVIKQNRLVFSKTKISLIQTRIKFLGHNIHNGIIIPIKRSIEFENKSFDQIIDKGLKSNPIKIFDYQKRDFYPLYYAFQNFKVIY